MKKIFIILSILFVSCSKEEIPTKQQQNTTTCYQIMNWVDSPYGDYITIRISPYEFQDIKVKNYRDYMGKSEICDLTTVK